MKMITYRCEAPGRNPIYGISLAETVEAWVDKVQKYLESARETYYPICVIDVDDDWAKERDGELAGQ